MCGIAGAIDLDGSRLEGSRLDGNRGGAPPIEGLARMAGALAHRGPDEAGLYRGRGIGLAHTRLSIIDLAGGQQPMVSSDGTRAVVFNGEIFNYVELRDELVGLGRRFRTRSDTEVLLQAWEEWGEAAFARLNGQLAAALWDERAGRLVLVRDRLGVRPLYLCEHGRRLYFASEVKAIFAADPTIPRAIDPKGLAEVFTFWTTIAPRAIFRGVRELPPGSLATVEGGAVRESRYWTPSFPDRDGPGFPGSLDEAARDVRAALETATRLRMVRADVPVGCYVSGGLDSSLIAALAASVRGEEFSTFSLRFDDPEYDETPWQRAMQQQLRSRHHEVTVGHDDIARVFPQVIAHTERPILRTAPAPLFLLSQKVRDAGIKVVLTGEGADEMFAGYDLFREAKVRRFWAHAPRSTLRPRLLERLYPYLARSPVAQRAIARQFFGRGLAGYAEPGFGHDPRWRSAAALQRLLSTDVRSALDGSDAVAALLADLPAAFSRWTPLAQDQYLEIRTLLSGYILSSQGDRMLMAHSVEGRFPFLDPNVVALAASLPPAYKLHVLDEKHVLKRLGAGLLPEEILRRPKQPYRAPDARSFTGDGAPEWIGALLDEPALRDAGLFDPRAVGRLWAKCRARRDEAQLSNADNMALVGVLSAQLLHQQFVREWPGPAALPRFGTVIDRSAP